MLPKPKRNALHAIYAFCRLADDIADDPEIAGDRTALLARWREELDDAFRGKAQHGVGVALSDAVERFRLPERVFLDLLAGVEFDLANGPIETFDDLQLYCYRVASTVGLLVVRILGFENPRSLEFAETLGIAVQLTNVLRDVGDDASTGRIYLPKAELERFGISTESILAGQMTAELQLMLSFNAKRAASYYERAEQLLPDEDRRCPAAGHRDGPHLPRAARRVDRAQLSVFRAACAPLEASSRRDRREGLDGNGMSDHETTSEIGSRKDAHLAICAERDVEHRRSTLLDQVHLLHDSLPELAISDVDLSVEFFGRRLQAPIVISGMSGGTDNGRELNRAMATAAQKFGLAMGVGSQRAMLVSPDAVDTFRVREVAPDILLFANLGCVQARDAGVRRVAELVESIRADAICIHLNPAQELVQDEGDRGLSRLSRRHRGVDRRASRADDRQRNRLRSLARHADPTCRGRR